MKGYKFWRLDEARGFKCFIGRDVTFVETRMAMTSKDIGGSSSKIVSRDKAQFEVESPGQSTGGKPQQPKVEDQLPPEESDYQLTRDGTRRNNVPPKRFSYADLICYALNAA